MHSITESHKQPQEWYFNVGGGGNPKTKQKKPFISKNQKSEIGSKTLRPSENIYQIRFFTKLGDNL